MTDHKMTIFHFTDRKTRLPLIFYFEQVTMQMSRM